MRTNRSALRTATAEHYIMKRGPIVKPLTVFALPSSVKSASVSDPWLRDSGCMPSAWSLGGAWADMM